MAAERWRRSGGVERRCGAVVAEERRRVRWMGSRLDSGFRPVVLCGDRNGLRWVGRRP